MNKETIHIENLSIGYPGKGDVKVVGRNLLGQLLCSYFFFHPFPEACGESSGVSFGEIPLPVQLYFSYVMP